MKRYFVAQEDTNLYNVFDRLDFDNNGWYVNHKNEDGYHETEFDVVAEFDDFADACNWIEEHSW